MFFLHSIDSTRLDSKQGLTQSCAAISAIGKWVTLYRQQGSLPEAGLRPLTAIIAMPMVRPMTVNWTIPDNVRPPEQRKVPHFLRIRDDLASQVESGSLTPQTRLPSERELSQRFGITRMTVRQALRQLEAEGFIYRLDRRGWFVSPPRLRFNPTANIGFTENARSQGKAPGTRLLSKEMIEASSWVIKHLAIAEGEPVFLIRRLRSIDGRTVLVEHLYVNAARCPGLLHLPLEQSLTNLLEQHYGIVERRVRIRLHPTALNETQAKALQVAVGTPGLYLARTTLDQFNNVIEFDQEFWRHDVLEVEVDVHTEYNPVEKMGT